MKKNINKVNNDSHSENSGHSIPSEGNNIQITESVQMNERIGGVSNYQHFNTRQPQERIPTGYMETMGANVSVVSINLGNDILETDNSKDYELIPRNKQLQNMPKMTNPS